MSNHTNPSSPSVSIFLEGNGGWLEMANTDAPTWRGYTPDSLRLSIVQEGIVPESLRNVMLPALVADEAFEHAAVIRDMFAEM